MCNIAAVCVCVSDVCVEACAYITESGFQHWAEASASGATPIQWNFKFGAQSFTK